MARKFNFFDRDEEQEVDTPARALGERDDSMPIEPSMDEEVTPPDINVDEIDKVSRGAVTKGLLAAADTVKPEPRVELQIGEPELLAPDNQTEQDLLKLEDETGKEDYSEARMALNKADMPEGRPGYIGTPSEPEEWAQPSAPQRESFASKPASPKDQVFEALKAKFGARPGRKDFSGFALAESGANQMAGTKSSDFYGNRQAFEDKKMKDWESDRDANQRLVEQSIRQRFEGEQNDKNRAFQGTQKGLDRQVDYAKMTSSMMLAAMQEAAKEGRFQEAQALKEELQRRAEAKKDERLGRSIEAQDTRAAAGRANSRAIATGHDNTAMSIANVKAVDKGVNDMGKIDRSSLKASEDVLAAGTANPGLWDSGTGLTGAYVNANIPGTGMKLPGAHAIGGGDAGAEFRAQKEMAIQGFRHNITGATRTPQETADFNKALGDVSSSNGRVAAAAFKYLTELQRSIVADKEAAVRPEARKKFQENRAAVVRDMPHTGVEDDDEDAEYMGP